jgi:hypothetical protein
MDFLKMLSARKDQIVKAWFDHVVRSYPADSAKFLQNVKDQFANPVGSQTLKSLGDVFNAIVTEKSCEEIVPLLDPAIRVRAVQEFSPSASVSFVFRLKTLVREIFEKEINEGAVTQADLDHFDQTVDGICLIAFDIYMGCREQIFKFKAEHVKSRTLKLLEKADILCEVPEVGTEIIPHNVYKNGGFESK